MFEIFNHFCKFHFRSQKKEFLQNNLSDDEKTFRRRKATISIQMTIISWTMEALTGVSAFVLILCVSRQDSLETIASFFILLNHCLYFILIPLSYLFNTQVWKAIVIAQGWFNIPTPSIPSFASWFQRIVPENNENLE